MVSLEIYALLRDLVGCRCPEFEPERVRLRDCAPSTFHLRQHLHADALPTAELAAEPSPVRTRPMP